MASASASASSLPLASLSLLLPLARRLHTAPVLMAVPGKKKKAKLDPSVLAARQQRRYKRLQKALVKMNKKPRLMRPLKELEVTVEMKRTAEERKRHFTPTEDVIDQRALMHKQWNRFAGTVETCKSFTPMLHACSFLFQASDTAPRLSAWTA